MKKTKNWLVGLMTILLILVIVGCGSEQSQKNNGFIKTPEQTETDIKIEDIDFNIDFEMEDNFRYLKFWYTNNSNYEITSLELKMGLEIDEKDLVDDETNPFTLRASYTDSVKPSETSEKEEVYGRKWANYKGNEIDKLTMKSLSIKYINDKGEELEISYDFELEKYSVTN